ncbi:MAG: invasin domain 3-containing protein [Desulfobacterales bacterium]|jgi:hypothetical protein|nr:invasin domain 3-containing protein [Desulfobacterales bacterium]
MERDKFMKRSSCIVRFLVALPILSIILMTGGCSSDGGGSDGSSTPTPTQTPFTISLSASSNFIDFNETTSISAVVYDDSGNTIAGESLIFTVDDPLIASVTRSAVTGSNGTAITTFSARTFSGDVNVTATAGDLSSAPIVITILSGAAPSDMSLTINPSAILVKGTSTVQARVLDDNGGPVSDGTTVSFSSGNVLLGTFSSATTTTNSGYASATFNAASQPGTVTVTVKSAGLSETANITILPAPAAVLQFVSATPQLLAIQGSGGIETAVVKFVVKDSNDDPVEGTNVSFVLQGPNGGEYIDPPPDATPKQIDVSTGADGVAQVILHSGAVSGPVTIRGTTYVTDGQGNQLPISAQSSVISIGGGVPSAKHFSVAASKLNVPGLGYNGLETAFTVYLSDRFGNYNILQGTTVSFISEAGLAVDTANVTLDATGVASVTARTQIPSLFSGPENVQPLAWESSLQNYIANTYGINIGHPRDGRASVLVYVRGEEHFSDSNANGVYDAGETFTDTLDDPFNDFNDNNTYDGPSSSDPQEPYIDAGSNGIWNGSNNRWDSNKFIFMNFPILLTGPLHVQPNVSSFTVADGSSAEIRLLVCDENGNIPPAGTKLSVSIDKGRILGTTDLTYTDSNFIASSMSGQLSQIEFVYNIEDADAGDTKALENAKITFTVDWAGEARKDTYSVSVYGTID